MAENMPNGLFEILNDDIFYLVKEDGDGELDYMLDENMQRQIICNASDLDWEEIPIHKIYKKISRGASPRPIDDFMVSEDEECKYGWLKISDVTASNIFLNQVEQYISEDGMKKSRLGKKGDLLITNSMTVGVPIILNIDTCFHDGFLHLSESTREIFTLYAYYYFLNYRTKLQSASKGGIVKNLNIDLLKSEKIKFPKKINNIDPFQIQLAIVKNIEKKIEAIDSHIQMHEASIMLTLKMISLALDKSFVNKTGFVTTQLKNIITERSEKNKDNEIKLAYSVTNNKGIIPESEKDGGMESAENKSNYKKIVQYDFAYNPTRINVGSIGMLRREDIGVVSPIYVVFSINENTILPELFEYYIKSNYFHSSVNNNFTNAIRPKLEFNDLANFIICHHPNPNEQAKEIEEIKKSLEDYENQIRLHKASIAILNKFREKILTNIFGE